MAVRAGKNRHKPLKEATSSEIVVIGMGYVGIPTAALFADVEGFNVTGVQRRSERSGWKIDHINAGKSPIAGEEPGLSELIGKVVKKGTLGATDDFSACKKADAILSRSRPPSTKTTCPNTNP